MRELEERILKDGKVLPGGVLKVGSFLNHCIGTTLLAHMADEVAALYKDAGVTKILTIEASGIALAAAAGMAMGVPVVFAKKHRTTNVDGGVHTTVVHSFTHNEDYNVVVADDCMDESDNVLIIDDFLANGCAVKGLIEIINAAGATLEGVGIVIEKGFQPGGKELRAKNVNLHSLAIVDSMSDDMLTFRSED